MEPVELRLLASGSEYHVYVSVNYRVCKVPRLFSWRNLTWDHAADATQDLVLLTQQSVVHVPTEMVSDVHYRVQRGRLRRAKFVLWQPLLQLQVMRRSHIANPILRRALTRMLEQSIAMMTHGRSIDFAGVGSVPDLLRSIVLRQRIDVPLHNLHVDGEQIVLMDVGLLPIRDHGPMGWLNNLLTQIQHAFIQLAIADNAQAGETVPPPNCQTVWGRFVHLVVRCLYWLVPKTKPKGST